MRKMTKTAAILAAMSAMTVASASMAFAATTSERANLSATGKEASVDAEAVGEWKETKTGWTFTPAGESKLEKTWAQIDGVWYYFDTDGIMLQNELVYLDGETYYLNPDGSMMAGGWVKFSENSDVLWDYDIDPAEYKLDTINNVVSNPYSNVWMYFDENGIAKDDEWYQAESGLWYYFDDIVMVAGDFDHIIGSDRYGFDKNGAMLVGWAENYNDLNKTAPNKDERTWYWYDTNGKKFKADKGYKGSYGWKKIDDEWYCFTAANNDTSCGTLIVKAFFTNDAAADGNSDYYYVDKNGVMRTGVVTVDKDAAFVGATSTLASSNQYTWTDGKKIKDVSEGGKSIEVYINGDGKVQADTWNNDKYYAKQWATNLVEFDDDNLTSAANVSSSGYVDAKKNAAIKGALVKSAFVLSDKKWYYVDEDGDLLKNTAIEVGSLDNGTYKQGVADKGDKGVYRAYVLSNKSGIIYTDIAAGREVKLGSKTYVATGSIFRETGAQIFYYKNEN